MSLRSNDRQWGSVAKFFHWVIALGILGNGLFGLLMDLAHSPMQKINWLALHKSIGTAVLLMLVALAGLAAYLTRDGRSSTSVPTRQASSVTPTSPTATVETTPPPHGVNTALPVPPDTHNPIAFGKATAVALWSYDTRAYSQPELVAALHRWLTSETKYADSASVDALVPSPVLWKEMAANGQHATAAANEAHFPESFTQALQANPGAITTAYVYAVTVTGQQSIAWNGSPHGGAEARAITLAVQCRPGRPCALAGILPNVAP